MPAMKVKEADILIVPGYTNSGPDHWQSRWQARLSTARRVEQAEWSKPVRDDWTANVAKAVNEAERPVVVIAHSLGVPSVVNVDGVTRALKTGDRVRVDGDRGIVERVTR